VVTQLALEQAKWQEKKTGKRVVLSRRTVDYCSENLPDCNIDDEVKYVYPDGKIQVEYIHSY